MLVLIGPTGQAFKKNQLPEIKLNYKSFFSIFWKKNNNSKKHIHQPENPGSLVRQSVPVKRNIKRQAGVRCVEPITY